MREKSEVQEETMIQKVWRVTKETSKKAVPGFVAGIFGGMTYCFISNKLSAPAEVAGLETSIEDNETVVVDL